MGGTASSGRRHTDGAARRVEVKRNAPCPGKRFVARETPVKHEGSAPCGFSSGTRLAVVLGMPLQASTRKRRLKKGVRNHRRRTGNQGFFVPDHSGFFEGLEDGGEYFRLCEKRQGPGAPSGRLIDGRPFVTFTDLLGGDVGRECFWIDPAGLENATVQELGALLRRSDPEWFVWAEAEHEVSAVRRQDDRGRWIWEIRVQYPLGLPDP